MFVGRPRFAVVVAFGALLHAGDATAQQRPRIEILLPAIAARSTEPPAVRSERLLADSRVYDLLTSGFPARVHYTLERWTVKRWFDDLNASFEWAVVVRHDPLEQRFRVYRVRGENAALLGVFATLGAVDSLLSLPTRTGITTPHRGERSYYALRVEFEMLSVSDLDELERWLRGEVRPAVRGARNPGTALERGARTLLVRALGGERRRYSTRTEKFAP